MRVRRPRFAFEVLEPRRLLAGDSLGLTSVVGPIPIAPVGDSPPPAEIRAAEAAEVRVEIVPGSLLPTTVGPTDVSEELPPVGDVEPTVPDLAQDEAPQQLPVAVAVPLTDGTEARDDIFSQFDELFDLDRLAPEAGAFNRDANVVEPLFDIDEAAEDDSPQDLVDDDDQENASPEQRPLESAASS